jgi:hypothetical protein
MQEPCFCKKGPMSQCIAYSYVEQALCVGFEKSSVATRCMHRNEDMANHCWNPEAQSIGLRNGISDEPETQVVSESQEKDISCINCMRYSCTYIKAKMRSAEPDVLTIDDLRAEANNCQGYEQEVRNE